MNSVFSVVDESHSDTNNNEQTSARAQREARKTLEDSVISSFINLVQLQPAIWKKEDPSHSNNVLVNLCWKNILDELEKQFSDTDLASMKLSSIQQLKTKLRTLRDGHVRYN